ncbi:MAG: FtsX-like permease family protein [Ignavibacteria bacterium]|jgi:ABC-type lipoprotein release transport system permease subunit
MLTLKLALKNITHAGLRTWLNVAVLSFAFVLFVWTEGFYEGMSEQIKDATIDSEIGGGQFWQQNYDEYDPFSLDEAHAKITEPLSNAISKGDAAPILITSSALFVGGHVHSAKLKGIDPSQKILDFPSDKLLDPKYTEDIPAIIGQRMANSTGLKLGDYVTVRWKDINGTFDAIDLRIAYVMSTQVQSIDNGQIWIPLKKMQGMMAAPDQATIIVLKKNIQQVPAGNPDWVYKDHDYLLKEINNFIEMKKGGTAVMYVMLLAMALLAVFDTQVLSIFRRRKEMGTMMAMGMTRANVISLFTCEGTFYGLLAIIAGAIYGIPILNFTAANGIGLPEAMQSTGFSIGTTLYPKYSIQLFLSSSLILFVSVLIVSFLPTRKIAKLKPTDALRGKIS